MMLHLKLHFFFHFEYSKFLPLVPHCFLEAQSRMLGFLLCAGFSEYVYHFGRSLSTTINFFPHSHLMSLCLGNTTGDGFATKVASNSLYIVDVF